MSKWVKLTVSESVATVMLDNPVRRNALSGELVKEFLSVIKKIKEDASIRVVVIRGAGDHFCAGADIQWMKSLSEASYEDNKEDALQLAELFHQLYHLTKPTVALVQGAAIGGALGILSCCDLVIAQEKTQFAFSEVKIGLVPAVISPYIMAAIGVRQARRYFLTAETFFSHTAMQLGLVHIVSDELDATAAPYIKSFLQSGPQALGVTKELISLVAFQPIGSKLAEETAEINARLRRSEEGREGLSAFLQKRKPSWQLV